MTRFNTKLAVAVSALVAGTGVAAAQMNFHHQHHDDALQMFRLAGLTDAQKAQTEQILAADRAQARPICQQLHSLHEAMAAKLLASGSLTAEDMQPILAQAQQLRLALDTQHLNEALQIRGLLTPAQLAHAASVYASLADLHQQERALLHGTP